MMLIGHIKIYLFIPSIRVFYENEVKYDKNIDHETAKASLYQYLNEGKMPKQEELERRTRFGELIYVKDYVRSDGVKVSGYYRRYPN